jgi:hypothetical protein
MKEIKKILQQKYNIVIKYYFVSQNNILCVVGYEISKEFIPI